MTTISETLATALQCHQAGYLQAAEQMYREVVAADPGQAGAWHLLGVLNGQLGRNEIAIEHIRRALALDPESVEAHYNLGKALMAQQNLDEAAASFRRAIELKPDYEDAHNNLGLALQGQRKLDQAADCFRRALELNPRSAAAHNNLGLALYGQKKADEAVTCCRRALELEPGFAAAHNNLGLALLALGKTDEAAECFQHAIAQRRDFAEAFSNLSNAWQTQGRLDDAVACCRRALELKPQFAAAHSNLLCILQYRSSITLKELADAHAEFEQRHCAGLRAAWRTHENIRDPQRRLRLGFLSCDLHRHPVGYFLVRLLENLDQRQAETVCYYDGAANDDLTARLQAAASAWSEVRGRSDDQLAEQIRTDSIDILFDLAGHTAGNRLSVFARKPAPIQVTWAGYVGTTGLAAMDYVLADRYEIPPLSEAFYCERVLRMLDGYICYDPPDYAPPVSPLPAAENRYVTFAAFHKASKITPQVVEVWARILTRLPEVRLLLKYGGMDSASVAGRFADLFVPHGIDAGRLEFLGFSPHAEAMAEYGRVDVALDTFPYNGGLTTCEALWMGVPVVTCPGETFAGRHSLSHLSNVGLTETIAGDLRQYVEIAVDLASDLTRLAALRAGLRERMAASPLCDGKRFAASFAEVVRGVWRESCERGSGFRVQVENENLNPKNPEP